MSWAQWWAYQNKNLEFGLYVLIVVGSISLMAFAWAGLVQLHEDRHVNDETEGFESTAGKTLFRGK
jgi:hypothetical protein